LLNRSVWFPVHHQKKACRTPMRARPFNYLMAQPKVFKKVSTIRNRLKAPCQNGLWVYSIQETLVDLTDLSDERPRLKIDRKFPASINAILKHCSIYPNEALPRRHRESLEPMLGHGKAYMRRGIVLSSRSHSIAIGDLTGGFPCRYAGLPFFFRRPPERN
jgi:hypothetical protein